MSKNNNMFKHFFSVNYLYLIMIFFLLLFDEICANTCSDIIRKDSEWNNGTPKSRFNEARFNKSHDLVNKCQLPK